MNQVPVPKCAACRRWQPVGLMVHTPPPADAPCQIMFPDHDTNPAPAITRSRLADRI
ncbi:MAG: hypothetical protein OEU51_10245 [Gammaproteobacteria bacterium]|nr:hypothetical protein [Gammaproteobacteria bacterium]